MRGRLQICSYMHFNLSRRTASRKKCCGNKVRTDLQPFSQENKYAVRSKQSVQREAAITIETAVVLPLFLFAVLAFCYLFQVMEFQIKLQAALNRTAEQTASYGYVLGRIAAVAEQKTEELLEKTELFSEQGLLSLDGTGEWVVKLLCTAPAETALKRMTALYIDTNDSGILRVVGGFEGISFEGSCLRDEERCVVVTARYRIRVPFVPDAVSKIELCQSAVCRLHCGDRDYVPLQKEDTDAVENDEVYYVTPNGSVYHRLRECRYLKITVLCIQKDTLMTMRNSSGGKYYPCRLCVKGAEINGAVFYTKAGSSYHSSENCSSLSRTVLEKTKEEVMGLPPCSNCEK